MAKDIAKDTYQKVEYSQHKGLNDQQCEAPLLQALADHGSLTKQEISKLLWNILSDQLTEKQKQDKVDYILRKMKKNGKIYNKSKGNTSSWLLVK